MQSEKDLITPPPHTHTKSNQKAFYTLYCYWETSDHKLAQLKQLFLEERKEFNNEQSIYTQFRCIDNNNNDNNNSVYKRQPYNTDSYLLVRYNNPNYYYY